MEKKVFLLHFCDILKHLYVEDLPFLFIYFLPVFNCAIYVLHSFRCYGNTANEDLTHFKGQVCSIYKDPMTEYTCRHMGWVFFC